MQTVPTTENLKITLPNTDMSSFRSISKEDGLVSYPYCMSDIDKGLHGIRKGNVNPTIGPSDLTNLNFELFCNDQATNA